jgi:glycine/D-amino acid oxidase-like deaminating enzyme
MNATNTDIVIVGGGVIGNSIAYHLARGSKNLDKVGHPPYT